ncbi:cyclin-dependent kinase 20 isoform X1 [Cylas formicarius]|uniref:cyclin-dependent kinase 20 isoform X1 n=1 Tax=Cylas formicarius TaxID=197179 RepID=UPI002958C108|nr:cyclin-dependent kinase 20 isoform X1 [Cylas formicarius]
MESYKITGRAGEGAHGFVFKGVDLRDKRTVAMKKIPVNPDAPIPKNTMREILALRALKSKYIVHLLDITCMGSAVVLIMEYLPCSLADVIKNSKVDLSLAQVKTYAKMLLKGVGYMHSRKIMHRDIKPGNLLISPCRVLKIADFGLARIYDKDKRRLYSHQVATRWYRAPELLYGSRTYTNSVDLWSVGCILAEMINRAPLFPGESDIEQLAIVLNALGTPNERNWPGVKDLPDYNKIRFRESNARSWRIMIPKADEPTLELIKNLICYNDNNRLQAKQCLNHHFFAVEPKPAALYDMPNPEETKIEIPSFYIEDFDEIIDKINGI